MIKRGGLSVENAESIRSKKMEYIEKTVKKNYVFRGKILTVRQDEALQADGKPCTREMIEHSGGACVLYVEDGKALLVRQYRYPYGESVYEIPAGKLEPGEEPTKAAARELEEEGGVRPERLQLLFTMYPTPGYTNEKIYIYRAYGGKRVAAHLDEGEFLDAEWIPLSRVKTMLQTGELNDAKTIIALQQYFLTEKTL